MRLAARIAAPKSLAPMRRSMRATWSVRVSVPGNAASTAASISPDNGAPRHLDAGDRKLASGAGRVLADEAAHGGGVVPPLPQLLLSPPAQQRNGGPIGIGADEGGITLQSGFAITAAQQRPFDDLLCHRIGGGCCECGCLTHLTLAHQLNRLFRRGEIRRQGGPIGRGRSASR